MPYLVDQNDFGVEAGVDPVVHRLAVGGKKGVDVLNIHVISAD
jgi:hypothetical protein